jgi:ABC-type proline/glycine betaine transport system permease subunit
VNDSDAWEAGEVVYGWSTWRHLLATTVTGLVAAVSGWLLGYLVFTQIGGMSHPALFAGTITAIALYTLLFPLFSWLLTQARPAVLRFGDDGLEIAAPRHDAVVVPYDIVSRARVRRTWPVTMFDVFVDDADSSRVVHIDRAGRRPLRRRIGGQVRFSMPTAGSTATPSRLRDQLRRRGLHQ